MITPRIPSGVMELLPQQQIAFQGMLDTIRRGYERFGFLPIETPVFELTDVLLTKSGGETEKQVYFVQSTGALQQGQKPELALRFDLTVPLARYVAQHERDLAFPFRRYQIQKVYRGERAQKGRSREFYQCDIDVIGQDSLSISYDAEMPAVIYTIFRELKVGEFHIHINNRKLLAGLFEEWGIAPGEPQHNVMRAIDKLDKVGMEAVLDALTHPPSSLTRAVAEKLLTTLMMKGSNDDMVASLRALHIQSPLFNTGLAELESVLKGLRWLGVPDTVCQLNLSIARGLDYYTGTVYETVLAKYPHFGSVCSGGRYDNLAEQYTRSKLPGVGISIGATRLFQALLDDGLFSESLSTTHVFITHIDPSLASEYLSLASELRAANINTEMCPEPSKIAKQIKYADRTGIPLVLMMGGDEVKNQSVTVKDLRTGIQQSVPRQGIAGALHQILRAWTDAAG